MLRSQMGVLIPWSCGFSAGNVFHRPIMMIRARKELTMEMLPAGTRCSDAREWVKAYIDAIVKATAREGTATTAAYSRGLAIATAEVRGEAVAQRMARKPTRRFDMA